MLLRNQDSTLELDIVGLRRAVKEDSYLIARTAQQHMGVRKITHEHLKYVVAYGDVVEKYPNNQPRPQALFRAHHCPVRFLRL
jgi:uncharacterized protein DUF4258